MNKYDAENQRLNDRVRELETENAQLRKERDNVRDLLATAANRINCAGPVHHRIDVLRAEHKEECDALRASLQEIRYCLRGVLEQHPPILAAIERAAQVAGLDGAALASK
jgi:predicted RNase H-like nuclease (RuvC/YqgF family)